MELASTSGGPATLEECCALLEASGSTDAQRFASLATLPKLFESLSSLDKSHVSAVVRVLPFDFLAKVLSPTGGEESKRYRELVLTILSALIPRADSDILPKFAPIIEPLLSLIEHGRSLQPEELEACVDTLLLLSAQSTEDELLSFDQISRILDAVFRSLKENTEKWPSTALLDRATELFSQLGDVDCIEIEKAHSWSADARLVLQRLLRTQHLPDKYRDAMWKVVRSIALIISPSWFRSDVDFLTLLASMTTVQLRCVLDHPSKIEIPLLITCVSLIELFMECVEGDDDFLDDSKATLISTAVQEAVSFACAFIGAVDNADSDVPRLSFDVQLVLYRFICGYLSAGGAATLKKEDLGGCANALLTVTEWAIQEQDPETAEMLISNIDEFPQLPSRTLAVLCGFLRILYPKDELRDSAIAQTTSVVEALANRTDWYDVAGLQKAKELAQKIGDKDLVSALNKL